MHRHVRMAAAAVASFACLATYPIAASRASAEEERIQDALVVLGDLTSKPETAIPRRILERADGIVVIPSLVKGGFIIGAKHGRGVMSVRDTDKPTWSNPAFVTMNGGSIGWQIGVESVDVVMLLMTRDAVDQLLSDKFTLGGEAAVSAGPVGLGADATSDAKMSSRILVYSRQSGLFAGATLEGASLRGDDDANQAFYGQKMSVKGVVLAGEPEHARLPKIADTWRALLRSLVESKD